jgi:hypothetical protein
MTHTAALFDLDGTLIGSEQRSQAAWTLLFRRHGVFLGQETLRGFCGRPGRTVLREHAGSFPGRENAGAYCVAVATLQPPVALAHADLVVPGFTDLDWPLDAAHEGSRP